MVTKDVKQINELRFLSKTECYKVENEPLFLLGLVSLGVKRCDMCRYLHCKHVVSKIV